MNATQTKVGTCKIGGLYLGSECFIDEANQTVGEPMISDKVCQNRRNVTSRLTDEGKKAKSRVIEYFKKTYDLDIMLVWNIYAGCSMCPCSPGFDIRIQTTDQQLRYDLMEHRYADNPKFDVWIKKDDTLDVREPRGRNLRRIKEAAWKPQRKVKFVMYPAASDYGPPDIRDEMEDDKMFEAWESHDGQLAVVHDEGDSVSGYIGITFEDGFVIDGLSDFQVEDEA